MRERKNQDVSVDGELLLKCTSTRQAMYVKHNIDTRPYNRCYY